MNEWRILPLIFSGLVMIGLSAGVVQAAPAAQGPDGPRNGVLGGQVINVTTNEPLGNIEVTLHIFQGDIEVETLTTQADSGGNYTFEKLPTGHSNLYMVEGRYQGITYLSDEPGIFVPNSTETTLDLKLYESTTSARAITITQMHFLVTFEPNVVELVQIFVVGNGDNHTYIGQNGRTFSFSLPEEARDVRFQNDSTGTRFIQTDTGYADTEPIRPGVEGLSIIAGYDIPYHDDTLTIEAPLPADVASLNVLMQEMGANISGEQIQFVDTRQVEGDSFSIYNGANFRQGETLSLKLTNLDELRFAGMSNAPVVTVPGSPVNQALLRWLIIGLGGLAIVGVGLVYPRLRPQLTHQAGVHHENPNIRRQKLLLTLARLDEVFETGELDEEVYRRARAKYKAELVEVMES